MISRAQLRLKGGTQLGWSTSGATVKEGGHLSVRSFLELNYARN